MEWVFGECVPGLLILIIFLSSATLSPLLLSKHTFMGMMLKAGPKSLSDRPILGHWSQPVGSSRPGMDGGGGGWARGAAVGGGRAVMTAASEERDGSPPAPPPPDVLGSAGGCGAGREAAVVVVGLLPASAQPSASASSR